VLVGLGIIWRLGIIDAFLDQSATSLPQDGRPAYVATAYPTIEVPRHATLKQRVVLSYFDLKMRLGKKNRVAYRFPPTPVQPCSVFGLLDQCMEVTGTHYLIAREAVTSSVNFGHTNTLTGTQWVAAFEQALRDEGLLLIRDKPGVVKVIPRGKLAEYQKAGLVRNEQ